MKNENCVKILMWILNHSPSDYEAAIISYDSEVFSPEEFITVTIILNELGIVTVDETQSDSLRILINDDSELYQKFMELKNMFDERVYKSSDACAAFCSLDKFNTDVSALFSKENLKETAGTMLSELEEYKALSSDDEIPDEYLRYQVIDKDGQLEEFEEFLRRFE